jgi:esterase
MKLFFRKYGEGRPLIILHGVFGMSDNWMTLAKVFAEKGFAVYTVDARNHGRSPHNDVFTFETMANDMLELMNDEKIEKAAFIGHSMGGRTTMVFSSMYPEPVEKLIVVDMSVRAYPGSNQNVIAALRSFDVKKISSRKEAEVKLMSALNNDEATVQFLLKSLYRSEEDTQTFAWRFNVDVIAKNMNAAAVALSDNIHFDGPVLFIRGEKSDYITDVDKPLIKKHFPKAVIKTIPNAGHWVHAENPKGFMQVVMTELT